MSKIWAVGLKEWVQLRESKDAPDPHWSTSSKPIVETTKIPVYTETGLWTGRNGFQGMSRYTDVYVRTESGWKATSAQITRAVAPGPRGRYKRTKKLL